jgi:glycyl-tRNA synthetase alpha subunit
MNLSGNTVNMFIFFNDITVASETCDLNTVYYTLGKLALAMFKVSPVVGLRQGYVEEEINEYKEMFEEKKHVFEEKFEAFNTLKTETLIEMFP